MTHIHVCLVSEHTIPNILAIHHFKPEMILFITTDDMERRGKVLAILKTLSRLGLEYDKCSYRITVREDSILDCHRKIDEWIRGREDSEFTVNLTGGTKIMSIAAYEYFKDYNSKMIYIAYPKNEFIIPFPKRIPGKPADIDLRLSVIQYLTAYGLDATNENKLENYQQDALGRRDLTWWIVENYDSLKNLLIWFSGNLREHRSDKEFELNGPFSGATTEELALLERFNFVYDNSIIRKKLTRSEIRYLTGGWLEEFCFNSISQYIGGGINDVVIGLQLRNKQGRDNEFDVMFTKDNALYFIECKSLDQHDDRNVDILYKIGALQKEFGLKVNSFLVTTSPYILKNGELRQSVKARAEQFKTVVITPEEICKFENILVEKLKLTGRSPNE